MTLVVFSFIIVVILVDLLRPSCSMFSVYVGLNKGPSEVKITSTNRWLVSLCPQCITQFNFLLTSSLTGITMRLFYAIRISPPSKHTFSPTVPRTPVVAVLVVTWPTSLWTSDWLTTTYQWCSSAHPQRRTLNGRPNTPIAVWWR